MENGETKGTGFRLNAGLVAGLVLAAGLQLVPPPEGLTPEAWRVASLALLMAVWWATEAVPLAATGMLPLIVLPLATDLSLKSVIAPPYASTTVLLLMGGSIMAKGIERWNLHERVALNIVNRVGDHPRALIGGFMAASALMSMWISNTATTLMMAPIALSAAAAGGDKDGSLSRALLLGVAYAASIGGVATPIGTPSNLIALSALEKAGAPAIGFVQWMAFGLPVALLVTPAAWAFLSWGAAGRIGHIGGAGEAIRERIAALGRMKAPELRVSLVFGAAALLWILRQPLQALPGLSSLSDTGIAIAGAVAMLAIPAGGDRGRALLTWDEAERIPWGMLLLFGGGLALAAGIDNTGLAAWLGGQLSFVSGAPNWLIVLCVVTLVVFLTELTSNVATTSTLMPVLAILATASDMPFAALAGPAAAAASCAFMLPVATAPNAIVYSTRRVTVRDMMRAGMRINLAAIVLLTLIGALIAPAALS